MWTFIEYLFRASEKAAELLYSLLKKINIFKWNKECKNSVTEFKKKLLDAPVLRYPNDRDPYTLPTDAFLTGIGAILPQKQGTEERAIACASKYQSKSQQRHSDLSGNYLQSFILLNIFKKYLLGQPFLTIRDHRALVWIYSFKVPEGMVARWIKQLGQFNFDIKHREGTKIPHADCLSRINTEDDEQTAFVNAIAMNAERDNTDYGSRGWQLEELQRVKLRDSPQKSKLLKKVYSWVLNKKKTGTTSNEKWNIKGDMEILGSVYKSLSHRRDFVS